VFLLLFYRYNMPSGCKPEDVSSNLSSDGVLVVRAKKPEAHEIQISQQQQQQKK
jgi:Hsp20/alpha crystallin family